MRTRRQLAVLVSGLVMILSGCAAKVPFSAKPLPEASDVLERLKERYSSILSIEASGTLRWIREGEKGSVDHVLLFKKPGSVRLDALSPLGSSMLSLAIMKGQAEIYVPGERRALRGEASEAVMERIFSLPLTVEEVVGVLCGGPILCEGATAKAKKDGKFWVLELECPASRRYQRLTIDPENEEPLSLVVLSATGDVVASVSWGGYRKAGAIRFPTEIRAEVPSKGNRMELKFKDVELNVPAPEEKFRLNIPQGVTVEPLS